MKSHDYGNNFPKTQLKIHSQQAAIATDIDKEIWGGAEDVGRIEEAGPACRTALEHLPDDEELRSLIMLIEVQTLQPQFC